MTRTHSNSMVMIATVLLFVLAHAPTRAGAYTHGGYAIITEGTCLDHIGWGYVEDTELCKVAFKALIDDGIVTGTHEYPSFQDGQWWDSNRPPGCHSRTAKDVPLFNTHHNTNAKCSATYPCICEKWGTEPLAQGEVFKPRNSLQLKLAVQACLIPEPRVGDNYCKNGWSKRSGDPKRSEPGCGAGCGDMEYARSLWDMTYCSDSENDKLPKSDWYYGTFPAFLKKDEIALKQGKFLLWESTGANCPAAFGPIGTWDTSLATNTLNCKLSPDSLLLKCSNYFFWEGGDS